MGVLSLSSEERGSEHEGRGLLQLLVLRALHVVVLVLRKRRRGVQVHLHVH